MLKSYLASLKQAVSVRAGDGVPPTSATATDATIGFAIMVASQAAIVAFTVIESPGAPVATVLLVASVAALNCVIPVALFMALAALSGRTSRIPLSVVAVSFYVTLVGVVSFVMSFVTSAGRTGLLGVMAYFMFRAARTSLGLGIGASIAAAFLVIVCTLASGLLIFVLPGGDHLVPA